MLRSDTVVRCLTGHRWYSVISEKKNPQLRMAFLDRGRSGILGHSEKTCSIGRSITGLQTTMCDVGMKR
ncbi:hypothetical protein MPTK1_2g22640 [Marchantia polymorpha subsp. ruderalis]|uniref:Uncharacterized protein n=1 Tax=Marchantia polymorpha TaxID=3197 RepID=A0A2R6WN89_MARPO|nr:hypothetical protein MARPO_0072s0067 [Marchantia polymorpha]BBN03327.1 hypothetical protein Mp_2g22640 [Marchantia polymorpha subsp. ruderalis]|eukprot:PTQ35324.1 hypothetical protein MARPO_0072s0067 [Marchantia polymorpha]